MSQDPPRRPAPTPRGQPPRRPAPMRRSPSQRFDQRLGQPGSSQSRPQRASQQRPPSSAQPRQPDNVDPFEEFRRKKEEAARAEREAAQQARASQGSKQGQAADPFEAFRRKKEQAESDRQRQKQQSAQQQRALKGSGWIDGIGPPAENVDPSKPQGFTRGRYARKKYDPNSLQRPAGFERTKLTRGGASDHSAEASQELKPHGFQRF